MATEELTRSQKYWIDREQEHARTRDRREAQIAKRLENKYLESLDAIQKEIDGFYGRYSTREGLSMADVRKRVTKLDIEKYGRKAKRYVKERNFTQRANEEMRLYNVTMKINRLELLKKNIELELLGLYSEEERDYQKELTKFARDEYERQAGILGDSVFYSEKHIKNIVDSSFLTAHWSDRLWNHQEALRAELDKLLNRGIVQGINPRVLARDLRKEINSSIFNSERLLITEFSRVQKDVFVDSMGQNEIEDYEYIAESTACPVCSKLDEKVFKVKDAVPGRNIYPMHPLCRCSAAAYIDEDEIYRDFDERGLTEDGEPDRKYNKVGDAYESVRLGSIDEEYKKHIENALLDLQNEYPIGEKRIKITNTKSDSAFGWNRAGIISRKKRGGPDLVQFEHKINFSNSLMKNQNTAVRDLKNNYPSNLSKVVEDSKGLIVVDHEYAHAIDNWYTFKKRPELLEAANEFFEPVELKRESITNANKFNREYAKRKSLGTVIKEKMMKDYDLIEGNSLDEAYFRSLIVKEYGDYAGTDIKEFLAEGFAVGRYDTNPTEFTNKFMKYFNDEFKSTFGG